MQTKFISQIAGVNVKAVSINAGDFSVILSKSRLWGLCCWKAKNL